MTPVSSLDACVVGQPYRSLVLVVEDDPRSARVACAHLENAGFRVSVAHTAMEAQQQVQASLPDLLLCDLCLPDMDGIVLTSWLRARPETANFAAYRRCGRIVEIRRHWH